MIRGAATKFWLGGGGPILLRQAHLPPNSDFSPDFGHFFLKILKNMKFLVSPLKKTVVKIVISGGTSPSDFSTGERVPPRLPGVGAHADDLL